MRDLTGSLLSESFKVGGPGCPSTIYTPTSGSLIPMWILGLLPQAANLSQAPNLKPNAQQMTVDCNDLSSLARLDCTRLVTQGGGRKPSKAMSPCCFPPLALCWGYRDAIGLLPGSSSLSPPPLLPSPCKRSRSWCLQLAGRAECVQCLMSQNPKGLWGRLYRILKTY